MAVTTQNEQPLSGLPLLPATFAATPIEPTILGQPIT